MEHREQLLKLEQMGKPRWHELKSKGQAIRVETKAVKIKNSR